VRHGTAAAARGSWHCHSATARLTGRSGSRDNPSYAFLFCLCLSSISKLFPHVVLNIYTFSISRLLFSQLFPTSSATLFYYTFPLSRSFFLSSSDQPVPHVVLHLYTFSISRLLFSQLFRSTSSHVVLPLYLFHFSTHFFSALPINQFPHIVLNVYTFSISRLIFSQLFRSVRRAFHMARFGASAYMLRETDVVAEMS